MGYLEELLRLLQESVIRNGVTWLLWLELCVAYSGYSLSTNSYSVTTSEGSSNDVVTHEHRKCSLLSGKVIVLT